MGVQRPSLSTDPDHVVQSECGSCGQFFYHRLAVECCCYCGSEDVHNRENGYVTNCKSKIKGEALIYMKQGALFRLDTRQVSGLQAVYLQKKGSSDTEWCDVKKVGWGATDDVMREVDC